MGLPLVTSAVFLVAQRLACRWCFSKSCWGRCFSVPEGTFWSQCAGCLCAVISQGLAAGFEGWSPLGVFSSCLAAFGLVFMSLTAAVTNTLLSGAGGWSPLVAAVVTLAMFLAWGVTGAGGWFAVSAEVPLSWFVRYIGQPQHLWLLLLQWPLLLVVGIGLTDQLARVAVKASAVRGQQFGNRMRVLIRKAFHVLAVAMFAPPILMNRSAFLGLSFLVACLLFIALEACRVCRTPMVGNTMDSFVVRYLDTKEDIGRGDLVLTHLYLLVGCAIPVWLEKEPAAQQGVEGVLASLLGLSGIASNTKSKIEYRNTQNIYIDIIYLFNSFYFNSLNSGILLIGVGDASAAAFGVSFGTHRSRLQKKHLATTNNTLIPTQPLNSDVVLVFLVLLLWLLLWLVL
ncbi:unnamed protein product [Polarella glacialis]|uniref:dolichol kinase n=1 Tax=Polarella glacialis TaxID=89957 RepID=A0A813FM50_POLGL|nr:unnamed protein product [Polarella glacialis]CAE8658619.1 unnamed protein product [Polarella glacialis]